MAQTTTTQEPAMTPVVDSTLEQHFRDLLANSICRLAVKMPYCSEDSAREELHHLYTVCGKYWLEAFAGISTAHQLIDKAIKVRAAAEKIAG
jgi:hypothetical protein